MQMAIKVWQGLKKKLTTQPVKLIWEQLVQKFFSSLGVIIQMKTNDCSFWDTVQYSEWWGSKPFCMKMNEILHTWLIYLDYQLVYYQECKNTNQQQKGNFRNTKKYTKSHENI